MRIRRPVVPAFAAAVLLAATLAPAQPPAAWEPRGLGGGGAQFAPSFNPHEPNTLTVTCDVGGYYRSTNLGASWTLLDYRQIRGNRGARTQYTSDPAIAYCIDYTDAIGNIPERSTDGGLTWSALADDPTGGEPYSIWADPASTTRLLLSDYANIYTSQDSGGDFSPAYAADPGGGCHMGGVFFDGQNVYAGANEGLLLSTNGGDTFASAGVGGIPADEAIWSFAGAREGATVRLFAVTMNAGDVYAGVTAEELVRAFAGVYVHDVGGAGWTPRTTGLSTSNPVDYPMFVACARNDVDTVYLAGTSDADVPTVYKSTNGGASWASVFLTTNNQNIATGWYGHQGRFRWTWGTNAMDFGVAPNDANKVAITDFGFTHLTSDGGATWRQVYTNPADANPPGAATSTSAYYRGNGLEVTACWWLEWASPTQVVAGYTDIHGANSIDGGVSWRPFDRYENVTLNTMYHVLRHPTNGLVYGASSSSHDIYQSWWITDARVNTGTGRLVASADGGATWQVLRDFGHAVVYLALDPSDSNTMYASVAHSFDGGVWVTNNLDAGAAATWTQLAAPPRTEGRTYNIHPLNDGTLVCTYSGRRAGPSNAFQPSSGVFASTNDGTSWNDLSSPDMQWWVKDLTIDPHDPTQDTWYVGVYSGFGSGGSPNRGGVYRTTDRGQAWTRLTPDPINVEKVAIHPTNPDIAYVTTEGYGILYTDNLTAATPTFSEVTSFPYGKTMRVFFNPYDPDEVWVATYGNGIRRGVVPSGDIESTGVVMR